MIFDPNTYVNNLSDLLKANSNPDRANQQAKYLRNRFTFFGLTHPELKEQIKTYIQLEGLPPLHNLDEVSQLLFSMPEREHHHVAIRLNERLYKSMPIEHIDLLEWMITHQSWWDTVDYISKLVGFHFKKYPKIKVQTAKRWIKSENLWLNRVAIIFQLLYKNETDESLLYQMISHTADSSEFFIQKASGWALRQYSKVNPESVLRFIQDNQLSNLTVREGMKYMNKQKKVQ